MGQWQLDFLVGQGLRPWHCLLDLACGSLRAGVRFIDYLEPGHYLGFLRHLPSANRRRSGVHPSEQRDPRDRRRPMTLNDQLQAMKEKSKQRIPEESRRIMERAIDDLRKSGAVERVVKVGDRAPDFTLPNAAGQSVRFADLVARGPVVLSFFRGRW